MKTRNCKTKQGNGKEGMTVNTYLCLSKQHLFKSFGGDRGRATRSVNLGTEVEEIAPGIHGMKNFSI